MFARDDRFAGPGVGLNGLVVHPHGFLLVVKKSDGALFKVPLADPKQVSQVKVDGTFVGGDGLTLAGAKDLVVVANATPAATTNAAFAVATEDDWASARIYDVLPLGRRLPDHRRRARRHAVRRVEPTRRTAARRQHRARRG